MLFSLNNLKIIVVVTLYIVLQSCAGRTSRSVEKDCCVLSSWEQRLHNCDHWNVDCIRLLNLQKWNMQSWFVKVITRTF